MGRKRVRGARGRWAAAPRPALVALAAVALAGTALVGPVGAAPVAPAAAQVAPDGLSATDGQRTLQVSQAADLAPGGQSVGVAGSGYDESKGIYVALCVVTPPDQPPSPCGGGIDIDGQSGASAWISSNPPSYGEGLATPYGPGGSFSVTISASPVVGNFDCRQVQCAIVTRNDHVRTADRSQDVLVPVTFGTGEAPPPDQPPAPREDPPPETTLPPPPPPTTTTLPPAPPTEVSEDGLTATDGTRRLTLSEARDLNPEGATVVVEGEAFDAARPVVIGLCPVPEAPTEEPAPCLNGSGASRTVSSDAPDVDPELIAPFGEGGTFRVELEVAAEIGPELDCRQVDCAVAVRSTEPADRSLDMLVPVTFADEAPAPTTTTTTEPDDEDEEVAATTAVTDDGGGGSSLLPWALGIGSLLAAVGVAAAVVLRKRRLAAATDSDPVGGAGPSSAAGPSAAGPPA